MSNTFSVRALEKEKKIQKKKEEGNSVKLYKAVLKHLPNYRPSSARQFEMKIIARLSHPSDRAEFEGGLSCLILGSPVAKQKCQVFYSELVKITVKHAVRGNNTVQ